MSQSFVKYISCAYLNYNDLILFIYYLLFLIYSNIYRKTGKLS